MKDIEAFRSWVAAALRGDIRVDPEVPFALLKEHHLAPLAHVAGDVRCRDEYAASAARAAQRGVLLAELNRAIGEAGRQVALIKGAAYASRIYEDPAERLMLDVDVLVPERDFDQVVGLLENRGFYAVGGPRGRSGLHHALTLRRGGAMLDVHRSMLQRLRARLPNAEFWGRAARSVEWPNLYVLEPVDELLISLLHAVRQELRVPLVAYLDLQRLLDRLTAAQTDELRRRAGRAKVRRSVQAALEMLSLLRSGTEGRPQGGLFGLPLPSTTALLRQALPRRGPRVVWKLALNENAAQVLGLGVGHLAAWADGHARSVLLPRGATGRSSRRG